MRLCVCLGSSLLLLYASNWAWLPTHRYPSTLSEGEDRRTGLVISAAGTTPGLVIFFSFFFFFGCAVGWWCCLEQVMGVYSYPCKHICVSTHVRFRDRCVSKLACKCVYTGACINMCDVYVCVHTLWINMGVSVHLCVTLSVNVWWKLCVIHVSMQEAGFLYMCFLHVYRCLPICGWGFSITRSAVSFSTDQ